MEQSKLDRINALARKSRESSLTPAELEEQKQLRAEYIAAFRGNLKQQLDQITLVHPDGSQEPLKERKKQ